MEPAQIVITLLGAGTLGAMFTSIVNGVIKYANGTSGRDRVRNADMRTQRNEAWADAERERNRATRADRNRGRLAEAASRYRRMLIEDPCIDLMSIPPWPDLEPEPPPNE